MKNTIKVFGIIALVAVIGFAMAACENDSPDEKPDAFAGTWTGQVEDDALMTLVARDGQFTVSGTFQSVTITVYKGTYTVSGNEVSITFTSINTGYMSGGADVWTPYDQVPQGTDGLPPKNYNTVINGNQFSIENVTFTKQG